MITEELLTKEIVWKKHSTQERYFFHYEYEKLILLRINNFPDEPLYTILEGLNILDLDDKPANWHLQGM